jgi:hypothetical protein
MTRDAGIKPSLNPKLKYLWLTIFFAVLIWSGINPKDYFTWFLEVLPALIGLIILAATYNRFRFTRLAYTLILIHCIILMVTIPLLNFGNSDDRGKSLIPGVKKSHLFYCKTKFKIEAFKAVIEEYFPDNDPAVEIQLPI